MDKVIRARWAGVYFNEDFILIETNSGYRMNQVDYKGKQHLLASDASDEALGIAVLDALAHSRFVLGAPRAGSVYSPDVEFDMDMYDYKQGIERYAKWIADLMAHYGYKTKRVLFKNMHSCNIESCNGIIKITPMHHEKLEMWAGINKDENVIILSDSTPAETGAALRLAFSRCTG